MKMILSLDGGGAKLPSHLKAIAVLEASTGKPCCELFHMIIGTSTGSIAAAMLSTGKYSAQELLDIVEVELPKVFKRKFSTKHKYSKDALRESFTTLFTKDACMGIAKTKLVITSYEDTQARMHFFKSWEPKDSLLGLFDAVDRSSAAPLFFGPVISYMLNRVFLDGGVTVFNNPSLFAFVEAVRLGWHNEGVHCFSLGCGHTLNTRTFEEATKGGKIRQLFNWWRLRKGGLARATASKVTCDFLKALEALGWWGFTRIDKEISDKLDAMDKFKYFKDYCLMGEDLGEKLDDAYEGMVK
jgi:hypothetical protein